MTGSLMWLARSQCGILHFVQDDIAVFRVTPPWEGKGEAFSLDFYVAKLLQRFLALDFAVIYCHLFLATPFISRTFTAHYGRQIFSCAAQVRFLFFGEALRARRTFGAEATPMCHDDINISYPAYLTSIIPPYIWAHRRATTWWNRQGHHRRAARWQQISHYGALINLSSSPITSSPPNMWISPQSPSIQGDKSLFLGWHGSEELWAVSYESWVTIQLVIALANFDSAWSFTNRNYHRFDKNLS